MNKYLEAARKASKAKKGTKDDKLIPDAEMLELMQAFVAGEVDRGGLRAAFDAAGHGKYTNTRSLFASRLFAMWKKGFIKVTRVD